jgi:ubiquinone/menaquinone biosynthesis C-methylase UbiE
MAFVSPEHAVSHFHLHKGDAVSDFGAGSGWFARALSRAVGRAGKVYAFEIQKPLVERVARLARDEHLDNVEVLWCDLETEHGCKLHDGLLDAGVLSNTLSQLGDKSSALEEIRRMLRKGGKLLVLDWSDRSGISPKANVLLPEAAAKVLVEKHHFHFTRSFPAGDHHYGLAFQAI